ncbi:MAG: hypothetical protein R3C55_08710 [Parvularculaceae bacterium]
MIGLDFPKTTERLFASWKPLHLAIFSALMLALVLIVDAAAPRGAWVSEAGVQSQYGPQTDKVLLRWRDRQDPRGFTTPAESGAGDGEFGLAWISGSSISIRAKLPEQKFLGHAAYEMTDVLAMQTQSVDGKPLRIHEYMIQGARTGDIRRATLHAAYDPEVDAIVISLNPVWLFNDLATLTESNQRASIAGMKGANLDDLLKAVGYARPSALLVAAIAPHSHFLSDRFPISRRLLNRGEADALPFPYLAKPEAEKIPYFNLNPLYKGRDFKAPESMKWIAGYRATLLKQTLSESGSSAQFFRAMLKSLAASGKPALLYVAPLPPEIEDDPVLLAFMEQWTAFADKMASKYGGPNIHLYTASYRKVDGVRVHKDIVHLHYGQSVVDEVASLLHSELGLELKQTGSDGMYGEAAKDEKE